MMQSLIVRCLTLAALLCCASCESIERQGLDGVTEPASESKPAPHDVRVDASMSDQPADDSGQSDRVQVSQSTAAADAADAAVGRIVTTFPGIRVHVTERRVEVDAVICLEKGWLEQIACSPQTREHESIMVVSARPSHIHQALLMIGLKEGSPGSWKYESKEVVTIAPQGDMLDIAVRWIDGTGVEQMASIEDWIVSQPPGQSMPESPWVFAGSRFAVNKSSMANGEHYVADLSGSIIGLVTFGDEVIACTEVMPDQSDVQSLEWIIREGAVPPEGTAVTIEIIPHSR